MQRTRVSSGGLERQDRCRRSLGHAAAWQLCNGAVDWNIGVEASRQSDIS